MVPSSLAFLDTRTFLLYPWQNYAQPISPFPLSFAFLEHIPRQHVAPHHKEIKQIFHHWRGAEMYISTVWLRSLTEVNKWLKSFEDPATSVRLLSDFSALKICVTLQGPSEPAGLHGLDRLHHLYRVLSDTTSFPLLSLQSPAPALLLPLLWLLFGCTTGTHFEVRVGGIYSHSKSPLSPFHSMEANSFWRNSSSLLTPSTATALILALHFLQGIGLLSPWVSIPRLNK